MEYYNRYIQDKENELIELLETLVQRESPTSSKEHNDFLGETISQLFIKYTGGTIQKVSNEIYGDHIIGTIGNGKEQILLVGHFDTVHPIGTLHRNPFRIEENKIFGPGIYDMKAGLVQGIFALHTLVKNNRLENKTVKFIFNSDEEVGSPTSRQMLIEEAKKSKIAFVMEPSFGEWGALKLARKGVASYTITTQGKLAHAGNEPEEGENAIEEISRQIIYLQGLNDSESGITVNCGVIEGGTAKNTIPEFAKLKVDVRVSRIEDVHRMESIFSQLESINPKIKLIVEGGFTRPPMEATPQTKELYGHSKSFMKTHFELHLPQAQVGGASDGNIVSPHVPTLDGLGAVGHGAHAVNEYIYKEHLVPRTALLTALIAMA